MMGTRVTATDIQTGESESTVIVNDYVLICDGAMQLEHTTVHSNGVTILTLRKRP